MDTTTNQVISTSLVCVWVTGIAFPPNWTTLPHGQHMYIWSPASWKSGQPSTMRLSHTLDNHPDYHPLAGQKQIKLPALTSVGILGNDYYWIDGNRYNVFRKVTMRRWWNSYIETFLNFSYRTTGLLFLYEPGVRTWTHFSVLRNMMILLFLLLQHQCRRIHHANAEIYYGLQTVHKQFPLYCRVNFGLFTFVMPHFSSCRCMWRSPQVMYQFRWLCGTHRPLILDLSDPWNARSTHRAFPEPQPTYMTLHDMETLSALLCHCEVDALATGGSPDKGPAMGNVFYDVTW